MPQPWIHRLFAVVALALAGVAAPPPSWAAPSTAAAWDACGAETRRQERAAGLPAGLLTAVSLVESGRWHRERREKLAWPWTVTSGGEGKFFPSKAEAVRYARALQARGVRNIDVGCMQINLLHHPDAFAGLEEAFEPRMNVGYATDFLRRLHGEFASWTEAATAYHSRTPHLAARYQSKLLREWKGRDAAPPPTPVRVAAVEERRHDTAERRADARAAADAYREAVLRRYMENRRR